MKQLRAIDLFCGAGGSSWGAKSPGVEMAAGFDMWELAKKVYEDNFPKARFYLGKLEDSNPEALARELGPIDLILASPECTNHSLAKGNRPRCENSRATAMQVIRYAKAFKPRWMVIENVSTMRAWDRYKEFIKEIHDLGYQTKVQVLNSADFGVPQSRRRLFILCDRKKEPDTVIADTKFSRTAGDIIDRNGTYSYSLLRAEGRAKPTLERAERAIAELGNKKQFLLVYYGSDRAGGWQPLDVPLRTITTLDRFAFVKPTSKGHVMRMLQPEELKLAMGWPKGYRLERGTRRDKIKMIGNAVCPDVMRAIVKTLTDESKRGH